MTDILDPLDAERDNPNAIKALMERYQVDEVTAQEMWSLFIDTVRSLRDRAKAKGNV